MSEDLPLREFQNALVELLASGVAPDDVIAALKADERFACYKDYIDSFDPDMVAVASELIGVWAVRKESNTYY